MRRGAIKSFVMTLNSDDNNGCRHFKTFMKGKNICILVAVTSDSAGILEILNVSKGGWGE